MCRLFSLAGRPKFPSNGVAPLEPELRRTEQTHPQDGLRVLLRDHSEERAGHVPVQTGLLPQQGHLQGAATEERASGVGRGDRSQLRTRAGQNRRQARSLQRTAAHSHGQLVLLPVPAKS